jgi:hypothetical protein
MYLAGYFFGREGRTLLTSVIICISTLAPVPRLAPHVVTVMPRARDDLE